MNQHVWWYVARASGIVAWALVTASVGFGLWVSLRLTRTRPRPAWVLDVHRFLGALSVVFVGVHLAGLALDSYVNFGPSDLFVPLAASWKPGPVALGIVGMYLLVAIEVTSVVMRRLPRRFWHAVHLTSFGLFVLATVHMFAAGTDRANPVLQWAALATGGVVGFLTIVRILGGRGTRGARRVAGPGPARGVDPRVPALVGRGRMAAPDRVFARGS